MVDEEGVEPSIPKALVSKTSTYTNSVTHPLVEIVGVEPTTAHCKCDVLPIELNPLGDQL
jgi:hypothetical protein